MPNSPYLSYSINGEEVKLYLKSIESSTNGNEKRIKSITYEKEQERKRGYQDYK